jgi:hypothetical protein
MRSLRAPLLLLGFAAMAGGCDITDLDINHSPNAATEAPGNLLFPTALAAVASNRSIEMQPATAEFVQIWASNGSASVFTDPEVFVISPFTNGNVWGALYGTSLRNLTLLHQQSLEAEPARTNAAAQADIMTAYVFLTLTQLFGDIPYTEALNGTEFPNPHFDSQESVLRGLVAKLDSATAEIDPENGGTPLTDGDLVYGGDLDQWTMFANSLKLRTLMLIRDKDASADAQISALLSLPLIRDNADEADIPFFNETGGENNLWKLNDQFAGFVGVGPEGNGFLFAGKTLVDLMKDLGDPRIDTYFALPVDLEAADGTVVSDEHIGQEAGVFTYDNVSMVSRNIIREDWPSRMVTAAEVWLYEAEFKATQGDLVGAHTSYAEGVKAGLDYFDGKPGAISGADKEAYLSSLPAGFASQSQALEAIWAQQYIEVFDRAPENWTQWRRTHYPDLPLPVNAQISDIIRRFPYTDDELSSNPNAPTDRPSLTTPMWFEK